VLGSAGGLGSAAGSQHDGASVRRYVDALNAHDIDAILACVAEDFVNEHTAIGGRNRHGRAEYRSALIDFLRDFAELHYAVDELICDQDRVAAPYRLTFKHRPSALAPVEVRGVFVFRVEPNGLIGHRIDYWDSGQVAAQLARG
jgi:steroid delta-isomerase-like uncharacterized protein